MKIIVCLLVLLVSSLGVARPDAILISDSETENFIKTLITPLLKAANFNPSQVSIRIIADPSINAFVTDRKNIFIHTGLIVNFYNDPNVIYGVLAHEIAHIYAGHHARFKHEIDNAQSFAMVGTILGVALAAMGNLPLGSFVALGSSEAAQKSVLQYSRANETEADKIAINLLYKTQNNGQGLLKILNYFNTHERKVDINPYLRTHPINSERIASIVNAINSKLKSFNKSFPQDYFEKLQRIAVKLNAFLLEPGKVLQIYPNNNYALAIANFRLGKLDLALKLIDQVLEKEQINPYLYELKGQFYLENGQLDQAIKLYLQSLSYLPKDQIISLQLAACLINKKNADNQDLNQAVEILKQFVGLDNQNIAAYYLLSRAYGKQNDQIKAISNLADYYFYRGYLEKSTYLAKKILKIAAKNSKEYLRAQDIIETMPPKKK